jgi:hypothetical protein
MACRLLKSKKAASEAFNIFIPLILFILACLIFIYLFHKVGQIPGLEQQNVKLAGRIKDANALTNILSSNMEFKTDNLGNTYNSKYNISIYEIFYYNLEPLYKKQIEDYIKIHESIYRKEGFNYFTTYYLVLFKNSKCECTSGILSNVAFIAPNDLFCGGFDQVADTFMVNGRCLQIRVTTVYEDDGTYIM